jgi:hypothetical protein
VFLRELREADGAQVVASHDEIAMGDTVSLLTTHDLSNPILNSPYEPPAAHFELGDHGPTGKVLAGRRPSESFIPVPVMSTCTATGGTSPGTWKAPRIAPGSRRNGGTNPVAQPASSGRNPARRCDGRR